MVDRDWKSVTLATRYPVPSGYRRIKEDEYEQVQPLLEYMSRMLCKLQEEVHIIPSTEKNRLQEDIKAIIKEIEDARSRRKWMELGYNIDEVVKDYMTEMKRLEDIPPKDQRFDTCSLMVLEKMKKHHDIMIGEFFNGPQAELVYMMRMIERAYVDPLK